MNYFRKKPLAKNPSQLLTNQQKTKFYSMFWFRLLTLPARRERLTGLDAQLNFQNRFLQISHVHDVLAAS